MGYIVFEYLAYVLVVVTLGALLFGASATALLVSAGAKRATHYVRKSAGKGRLIVGRNIALMRALFHGGTEHNR